MLKLPIGYRYLEIGEIILRTDLVNVDRLGEWIPYYELDVITCTSIGNPVEECHYEICRRNSRTPLGNIISDDL